MQVCPGLNYVCPNEGCGHCSDMKTEDDLRKHLTRECKFVAAVCENCELPLTLNETHNCVDALKTALAIQKSLNGELMKENEQLKAGGLPKA